MSDAICLVAMANMLAGWTIGLGLHALGRSIKEGLTALADALREIDET
jgi:hypothetical protein